MDLIHLGFELTVALTCLLTVVVAEIPSVQFRPPPLDHGKQPPLLFTNYRVPSSTPNSDYGTTPSTTYPNYGTTPSTTYPNYGTIPSTTYPNFGLSSSTPSTVYRHSGYYYPVPSRPFPYPTTRPLLYGSSTERPIYRLPKTDRTTTPIYQPPSPIDHRYLPPYPTTRPLPYGTSTGHPTEPPTVWLTTQPTTYGTSTPPDHRYLPPYTTIRPLPYGSSTDHPIYELPTVWLTTQPPTYGSPSPPDQRYLPPYQYSRRGRNLENVNVQFRSQRVDRQSGSQEEPVNYEHNYQVYAPEYAVNYSHQESRQEDVVKGEYHVLLPDGRTQHVVYTADKNGYHPTITYTGGIVQNVIQ